MARSFSGWSVARLGQYIRDTIRNKVYFKEQATAPGIRSGVEEAVIYAKDDSGTTKLYYKDSAGAEYTLGEGGGGGGADVGWSGPSADVISTTGSVGVGTTSPATQLEVREDESTTLTDFTQAVSKAGILINTDYTADAYTPGLFWMTETHQPTLPKAGIYLKETTLGTHLYLGTSNHYATGITTNTIVDQDGNVGIGTTGPIAELDVAGKVAITAESSTPSQPADGQGYIYTKTDGKLYWRSYDLTETDLTVQGDAVSDVGWTGPSSGVISTTGSIGIGVTNPLARIELEVADSENIAGVLIDFNETGNYNALKIDSESTTYFAADIYGKYGVRIEQDLSSGRALFATRDIAEAGSYSLAYLHDNNASNTQTTLEVRQDGTGDILNLFDGETEVFTVTDGGKVGIGVDAPSARLQVKVADSDNMKGILIDFDETSAYTALEIDSESTTAYGAYIHGKLGIYVEQDLADGKALAVYRNESEAGTFPLATFHDDHSSNTQTTVTIRQDGSGDILNLLDGSTEVFTVTDGGNVGIGVAAPAQPLHVEVSDAPAYIRFSQNKSSITDGTYLSVIQFAGTENGTDYGNSVLISAMATETWTYGANEGAELAFWTTPNGSPTVARRMTIAAGGNVGIGVGAPSAVLEVREDESTTLTDFTQAVSKAGILINTDYTADAYTPGLFWKTETHQPTLPKAGIYLKETSLGTHLYFGTSNTYSTGITTNTVIDPDGNVGIGTTAPEVPLDMYEMGGLSVAMTHLMPVADTNYTNTTSYVVPTSDWKITFTAPANGKIEIMFSALIAMSSTSDDYIFLGLSDNSTYNTLGAQYERHAYQASTGDNTIVEYSWLVTGLTAGTSYTYYVGSKYSGGGPAPAWYWGGTSADEYPPILIKALTVPDTIYAG